MPDKMVDARGLLCPRPLILTKEALQSTPLGQAVTVFVDNQTACGNILRFLQDHGQSPQTTQEGEVYRIRILRQEAGQQPLPPAPYRASGERKQVVVVLRSEKMGEGPEELGRILMQSFIHTLKEIAPLPQAVLFYNTGVLLAVEGSPLVEALQTLQSRGVEMQVCGACADFFRIKDRIAVGAVSNMYAILEKMAAADLLLSP